MVADRDVGAGLEVGPAEFVLDLLVALLDPVPQPVEPYHFGEISGWVAAVCSRGDPGRGRLVARYQVDVSGRVAGSVVTTTSRIAPLGPHQPGWASAAHQVAVRPLRKLRVTGCQSPCCSGPYQTSSRAASTGRKASLYCQVRGCGPGAGRGRW